MASTIAFKPFQPSNSTTRNVSQKLSELSTGSENILDNSTTNTQSISLLRWPPGIRYNGNINNETARIPDPPINSEILWYKTPHLLDHIANGYNVRPPTEYFPYYNYARGYEMPYGRGNNQTRLQNTYNRVAPSSQHPSSLRSHLLKLDSGNVQPGFRRYLEMVNGSFLNDADSGGAATFYNGNNYNNQGSSLPTQNPNLLQRQQPNTGPSFASATTYVSRTSILFVSISFIVLMIISLAWLVFYYVQRFRYAHAKDQLAKRLNTAAKKALVKIPLRAVKIDDKVTGPDSDACAVCIEGFKPNEIVRELKCGHYFHKACVDTWLLLQRSCPICKLDILEAYGLSIDKTRRSSKLCNNFNHHHHHHPTTNTTTTTNNTNNNINNSHHHPLNINNTFSTTTNLVSSLSSNPGQTTYRLTSSSVIPSSHISALPRSSQSNRGFSLGWIGAMRRSSSNQQPRTTTAYPPSSLTPFSWLFAAPSLWNSSNNRNNNGNGRRMRRAVSPEVPEFMEDEFDGIMYDDSVTRPTRNFRLNFTDRFLLWLLPSTSSTLSTSPSSSSSTRYAQPRTVINITEPSSVTTITNCSCTNNNNNNNVSTKTKYRHQPITLYVAPAGSAFPSKNTFNNSPQTNLHITSPTTDEACFQRFSSYPPQPSKISVRSSCDETFKPVTPSVSMSRSYHLNHLNHLNHPTPGYYNSTELIRNNPITSWYTSNNHKDNDKPLQKDARLYTDVHQLSNIDQRPHVSRFFKNDGDLISKHIIREANVPSYEQVNGVDTFRKSKFDMLQSHDHLYALDATYPGHPQFIECNTQNGSVSSLVLQRPNNFSPQTNRPRNFDKKAASCEVVRRPFPQRARPIKELSDLNLASTSIYNCDTQSEGSSIYQDLDSCYVAPSSKADLKEDIKLNNFNDIPCNTNPVYKQNTDLPLKTNNTRLSSLLQSYDDLSFVMLRHSGPEKNSLPDLPTNSTLH